MLMILSKSINQYLLVSSTLDQKLELNHNFKIKTDRELNKEQVFFWSIHVLFYIKFHFLAGAPCSDCLQPEPGELCFGQKFFEILHAAEERKWLIA